LGQGRATNAADDRVTVGFQDRVKQKGVIERQWRAPPLTLQRVARAVPEAQTCTAGECEVLRDEGQIPTHGPAESGFP
jgi:hypothetical protein